MRTHGNQRIQKLLFSLLFLCTLLYASETQMEKFSFAHEVKVLVSDTEIVAGQVIRLKIRATGDKVVFPNIEEINGVKVLEQQERVTNMFHYVNGVLKKERTTLILTFAPHHDMTIPSYDIEIDGKMYKSETVKIKVMPATARNKEDSNKFFLHLSADKNSVIVGEPVLATVKLSLKIGIRLSDSPQYTQPVFKGFFVEQMGDEKVYTEGTRQVTELKYLLSPLAEGNFTVGPASAKMAVADRNKRDMFGRFFGTTWVPIASNTVRIEVKKKPLETDLVGDLKIEKSIDKQKVKANKPVNLTVKISGEGNLEDFEFPDYEVDGVTIYSDDAEVNTALQDEHISSTFVKRFAFISDHDFSIPARTISVYDMDTKRVKYLEIPSYEIKVEGSSSVVMSTQQKKNKVQSDVKTSVQSMLYDGESEVLVKKNESQWWMILVAFVSGVFVMFLIQMLLRFMLKGRIGHYREAEALKTLYPHMGESAEVEAMVRRLYARKRGDESIVIDKTLLKILVEKYEKK